MYVNAAKQELDALVIEMILEELGAEILSIQPADNRLN